MLYADTLIVTGFNVSRSTMKKMLIYGKQMTSSWLANMDSLDKTATDRVNLLKALNGVIETLAKSFRMPVKVDLVLTRRRRGLFRSHIKTKFITQEFFVEKIKEFIQHCDKIVLELTVTKANEMLKKEMPRLVKLAVNKDREVSPVDISGMVSKEFAAHGPNLIEKLFRKHIHNTTLNLYPKTKSSTATTSFVDLQQQLYLSMKTKPQDQAADPEIWEILKAKFTKVIIHHFLFKHNSIPKRHDSFVNTIKYDGVLGKLKFVNKGEDEQMYGMLVPDVMMNECNSRTEDAYYADISFLPTIYPDEALQLGDSISLIEAEVEEEQRLVQNTHKRLVVKEAASDDESDETDTYKEEESLIRRRLTGILSKAAMYASNMKKATKAGMQDYRIQQHVQGSSKGVGSKLEVPDESKDDSGSSSGSSSSDDDTEVISLNEEKKDDNQEKAAHEAKDDEEMKKPEQLLKEKTHDEENAKEQEKVVHEEGDTKMKDVEHEENEKIEKEKGGEDKIEEETAYDEHAGFRHVQDEHTEEEHVADDQAGVIILKSQPEKSEAPPTSSSLILSSAEYGNKFLNDTLDLLMHDLLKEPIDTEVQSMVDQSMTQASSAAQQIPIIDAITHDHTHLSTIQLQP
ncbi:hypothetical protein Tco_0694744 [Tanacetum coccineum]